jgi:Ca-activated chloride channel family protein
MLHFANPLCLLLLLLVPALLWCWLRRRRAAVTHPDTGLLADLPAGRARAARIGGATLRGLGLACLALALAGPRWPDLRTPLEAEGIAVVMVLDVSGSMGEHDFDWNSVPITRLEAAQRAFRLFVAGGPIEGGQGRFEGRPTDLIGLVTFATRPEVSCPLTLSHSALLRLLDAEQPRDVPGDSETNLSDALTLGLARLEAAGPRRKVLVLLTDGEHNLPKTQSGWQPRQPAQLAASLDIPIYAIDTGGEGLSGDSSARPAALELLRDLARISRGQTFAARDSRALLDACRAIDRLERSTIASFQYRRYHEAYPWLGLAAFACFAILAALEATVWRRAP